MSTGNVLYLHTFNGPHVCSSYTPKLSVLLMCCFPTVYVPKNSILGKCWIFFGNFWGLIMHKLCSKAFIMQHLYTIIINRFRLFSLNPFYLTVYDMHMSKKSSIFGIKSTFRHISIKFIPSRQIGIIILLRAWAYQEIRDYFKFSIFWVKNAIFEIFSRVA